MSINAMNWVWNHSKLKGARKLMLLAIADWCNDDGECYYGAKKLTKKVGLSSHNSTSNMLRAIEKTGELTVLIHEGRSTKSGNTNYYYMTEYRKTVDLETPEPNRHLFKRYEGPPKKSKGVIDGLPQEITEGLPHGVTEGLPHGVTEGLPKTLVDTPEETKSLSLQKQSDAVDADNGDTIQDIELGSDGYLTEASWDKIEAMPTTDSAWLEQHALDGKWARSTWNHKRDGNLYCGNDNCQGLLDGEFYHDGEMDNVLCPGCWLKRGNMAKWAYDGPPPALAFEHGNANSDIKVPTYIIVDKVKYMVERNKQDDIMQVMLHCNCEVGFGDDTDFVVHTLYAVEAKGDENISVCLMCNTLVYGREHSQHNTPSRQLSENIEQLDEPKKMSVTELDDTIYGTRDEPIVTIT
ncbi:hypothetical protein LCGC14_2145450, partial [marine sediment metagenome]